MVGTKEGWARAGFHRQYVGQGCSSNQHLQEGATKGSSDAVLEKAEVPLRSRVARD